MPGLDPGNHAHWPRRNLLCGLPGQARQRLFRELRAMAVAVVFLPLIAAIIAGFFGRVIGDRGAQLVTCGALLLSAVLGLFLFRDILASDEARVIPLAKV